MERFIVENAPSLYFNRQLFLRSQLVLQKEPSLSHLYATVTARYDGNCT